MNYFCRDAYLRLFRDIFVDIFVDIFGDVSGHIFSDAIRQTGRRKYASLQRINTMESDEIYKRIIAEI